MKTGRIITEEKDIAAFVRGMKRVAVLGIKPETRAGQPAFSVPQYLQSTGIDVVPVPVYYPDVERILGQPVYRRLVDVPEAVDCVDVFRRPQDLMPHLDDIVAKKPPLVWLQLGIRNDAFAGKLTDAGIDVVQDRCLLVDHRRWANA